MIVLEQKLLTLLRAYPGPHDVPTLTTLVDIKGPYHLCDRAVRNALQRLAARGDIARPARGVYQSK